jgi:glucose/mannose-6-phosphate isomerase
MNLSTIERYDKSGMRGLLAAFPLQAAEAVAIAKRAALPAAGKGIENIVVTGLGGSAIAGDLLRSYLAPELSVPFVVNRHYVLPEFVGPRSLVIVSSYSGDTEETIAAHLDARKRKARVLCISTNGETARLARKFGHPIITIPKGLPPRAALGYSIFPMLIALVKMKIIRPREKDLRETLALLARSGRRFTSPDPGRNRALQIAQKLYGKLPVIYSAADRFDAVGLRWRGQLAENAKVLAFGNVLPEMNHNELVGWRVLRRQMNEMAVLFLLDRQDHKRIRIRMDITKSIVSEFASSVTEIESEGNSLLARMFSLIYLGDWVSFYLAMLNGIDPTPVKIIDYLKWELGKVR